MSKVFICCFSCWDWEWANEQPRILKCTKCGSEDCRAQIVDDEWGKNWHEDWVASSIRP